MSGYGLHHDLVQDLAGLTLTPQHSDFVGGFVQLDSTGALSYNASKPPIHLERVPRLQQAGPVVPTPTDSKITKPLPPPFEDPKMPVPQLLNHLPPTMQRALNTHQSPGRLPLPPRPYTDSHVPSAIRRKSDLDVFAAPRPYHSLPNSESVPALHLLPAPPLKVPTPTTNKLKVTPPSNRRRASSASASSSSSSEKSVQCSGITKAGSRCNRQVKSGPPLSVVHPEVSLERYCFQHIKEVMQGTSGFYSKKVSNLWIKFEDWVPKYLQPDTQVALRTEMAKDPSVSDVSGYIYIFEIRDQSTSDYIRLKVGRAVNLVKRLDQWDKQCGSKDKEHVLRGWWPGGIDRGSEGLMKGRVKAGEKAMRIHRLERLIHLELADMVLYQPYLNSGFLDAQSHATTTTVNTNVGILNRRKECPDCGTTHREIFSFKRVTNGTYKGKEWEKIVAPVIEKWGGFVQDAYV